MLALAGRAKAVVHRKFNDGSWTPTNSKQMVADAHRAFFLKRGIDPTQATWMSLAAISAARGRKNERGQRILISTSQNPRVRLADHWGFEVAIDEVNPRLFPHQREIVHWAVEGGRRAIFASFGLGKSGVQLEIVNLVMASSPRDGDPRGV